MFENIVLMGSSYIGPRRLEKEDSNFYISMKIALEGMAETWEECRHSANCIDDGIMRYMMVPEACFKYMQ